MSKRFLRNCLTFCLFIPLVFFSLDIHAQGYNFNASSGTFTALAGATAIDDIESDDDLSAAIPIGFSFTYFGTAYTTLKVSSNGVLRLDPTASGSTFDNNFSSSYTNLIAPLWDDLDGTGGTASYLLSGTAGSRVLTVEWLNWQWDLSANAGISFQVKLYEGTNRIDFVYRQEAGALVNPSASIGIIGNTASAFYSLANSSASPTLDFNGNNAIAAKPASNQAYTFTVNSTPVVAPTVAASAITVSPLGALTATFSWANGNGAYRAVFVKPTAGNEFFTPVNGVRYAPSSVLGSDTDWSCVYNGTGNAIAVTGLKAGFTYRVQVVEYNGQSGLQQYNTAQVASNFTTTLSAPSGTASSLQPLRISASQLLVNLTEGNGYKRVIFVKANAASAAPLVVNNTTYTASTVFGSGSQLGTSGWYCVFNNESSSELTITGLASNTNYLIGVVDYNGPVGVEKYHASPSAPIPVTTFYSTPALPTYTFAATTGTFTPITGAVAVNTIEVDDAYSASIPIGFTFRLGGTPFTQFIASSNGYITFNPFTSNFTDSDNRYNDLTYSNIRPAIAPFWDDLDGTGGQASYVTSGASPNRVFTLEYLNWKSWSGATSISFQIKLYEANNKIEYLYRQEAGALTSPSASIGLSLPDFTGAYTFLSLNNASASPAMGSVSETRSISTKPATSQVYSFTPSKLAQAITFNPLVSKIAGDATFNLTATANSGLPVTYTSSNTAVATVSGNNVTIVGPGTTQITASQSGDSGYNAAVNVEQPLLIKSSQTITFSALSSKTVGDANFNLTATSSSGLAVSYTSSNTAVATVSGSTVTIIGAGTTQITASQSGNATYGAAVNVIQPLVVKTNQTITFTAIPAKTFGDAPFALTASSSSGLPITYSSSNTSVATISGNTVTIVGAGTTEITASQAGDAGINAATSVIQPLVVNVANQAITFAAIPTKTLGDAPFALSASTTSALAVTFSTTSDKVTIAAGQVTLVKAGSVTIKADQAGNANYTAATPVERTFCVNPAKPVVTLSGLDTEAPVLTSSNTTGNQWFKEGVAISGSTGTTFSPTTPGIYTVISTVDNCSSVSSEQQAIIVTGVEDISKLITVFPNPAQKEVTIDLTSLGKEVSADVAIFDLAGRVYHSSNSKGKLTVNIASYDKGNYLVRVKAGSRIVTKQIAKN